MGYCKEVTDKEKAVRTRFGLEVLKLRKFAPHVSKMRKIYEVIKSHKGTYPRVSWSMSTMFGPSITLEISIRHTKAREWVVSQIKEAFLGKKLGIGEIRVSENYIEQFIRHDDKDNKLLGMIYLKFALLKDGTEKCRFVPDKVTSEVVNHITYKVVCDDNGGSDEPNPTS